jgi:hypothetical protein
MTGSQLIDAYLGEVAAALPGPARVRNDIVAELRSGLFDAADAHGCAGLPPALAAEAAIREFGDPGQIAAGFRPELAARQARHLAFTLIATGPLIGLLWAAAARASHIGIRSAPPWHWAGVPPASPVVFPLAGAAFVITVWTALFTVAATGRLTRWLPVQHRQHHGSRCRIRRGGRRHGHIRPSRQRAHQRASPACPGTRRRRGTGQPDPVHPRQTRRPPLPVVPREARLSPMSGGRPRASPRGTSYSRTSVAR